MKTKQVILIATTLLAGVFLGWLFFKPSAATKKGEGMAMQDSAHANQWTCIMHRQIVMNKPGKCPICGMTLVPLDSLKTPAMKGEIFLSKAAAALANIETAPVMVEAPKKQVALTGSIHADEQMVFTQTAHIPGRIDRLYIDFTGQMVNKGQKLAEVYSPDLVTAQKELLEAMGDSSGNRALYDAAVQKLKSWKLRDKQIRNIERSKTVQTEFDILADYSGVVTQKMIAQGSYIKEGDMLFQVTDISQVWVMLDAYQTDLPWLSTGDKLSFTTDAMPDKTFTSTVSFIDPVVNPQTRTASVRAEINNPGNLLKPGMFVNGQITCKLNIEGNVLVVPKSAVLWTGKRSIVYVKDEKSSMPAFAMREVTLSTDIGSYYVVKQGLMRGEEVVSNGTFQVDAAAQLAGKPSMMNSDTASRNKAAMKNMPGM